MVCNGDVRESYQYGSREFESVVATLRERFGEVNPDQWFSVTTPQANGIHGEQIVSVIFKRPPPYLDHLLPACAGRKYFMKSGWVYDKVYQFIEHAMFGLPYPAGATPLGVGYLVNVYGQPGDADLTHLKDLYFMHQDHTTVEQWAGQTLPQGKYSTFYAATFDTYDDNRLRRMKAYCYDDQGACSDWDVTYMMHRKRNRIGCSE